MSMFEPPVTTIPEPVEAAEGRTWNRIIDFRGGIYADIAPSRPPGQAQVDGTFQCLANAAGSLTPAPRLVSRIYRTITDYTSDALLNEQFRISGIHANTPVYSIDSNNPNTTGTDECHTELFLAVEFWTGADSDNADLHLNVSRYLRNTENPVWESVWTRDYATGTYDTATRPRNCVFASQRSNSAAPLTSGPQVLGWVYTGNARYFPKDDATTTSGTDPMPGDAVDAAVAFVSPTYLVGHQGRMVIFPLYVTGDGDDQTFVNSECAYWTDVNDAGTFDSDQSTYFNILGGYEQASGYGVIASLTADELFLVKIVGGGLFVSGDLSSPTNRSLPLVRSTGLAFNNGTPCQHGYVYPVDSSGVWLWAGGDTSEHITKHLAPDFWRPPALAPAYSSTTTPTATGWGYANTESAWWNEYVLWPNNWLWDGDEKGWWRILDPDIVRLHRWAADERGLLCWGSPSGFNTSSDPIFYEFSRTDFATYFSWRSHPQTSTIDRTTQVSEVIVCAQGVGQVRVSIETAEDPQNPVSEVFSFDATDRPQIVRKNVKAVGSSLVFRFESIGEGHDEMEGSFDPNATVDAPTIHYVDYCTYPSTQLPNA